jgi:hypothetical protein
MSIFSSILSKIFPHGHPATTASNTSPAGPATTSAAQPGTSAAPATGAASSATAATATAPARQQPVDVEAVLNGLAAQNPQKLNWRTSIVDLLKLLNLDSSFQARKALATELHYNGDPNDSAAMNIWLHKAVMQKLAENGGKVPADLKS